MAKAAAQPDLTGVNLSRLLSRLESVVLSADANPRLRTDPYERAKVGAVSAP